MSTIIQLLEYMGYRFEGSGAYRRCVQHDSLVINVEKDLFFWNSMGVGGNAIQFLTKINKMNYRQAKEFLENITGESYVIKPKPYLEKKIVLPDWNKIKYLTKRANYYHNNLLNDPNSIEFWKSQGIDENSVNEFKLGRAHECPTAYNIDSYTIPYHKDGNIIDITHRLNTTSKNKYRHELKGYSTYLFNSDRLKADNRIMWPGDSLLIEGEKKAIVLHQNGFRVASISGANAWKDGFIKEFDKSNIDTIYVALDPGMEEISEKLSHKIRKLGKKAKSIFLPDKPDDMIINGITPSEMLACL